LEAYILVGTEANQLWKVAESTLKIEGTKTGHAVAGEFDVVALVSFPKVEDLGKILEKVQRLEGVRGTETPIVIPRQVRE
jgi:DNA-binding Lrp family transcriptional regulator